MGNCISPLRRAIRARDTKQVEKLLKEAGESAPDYINDDYTADCFCTCIQRNYRSCLHASLAMHEWEMIELLLKYGADPECQNSILNQAPLHIACRDNNLSLVRLFVEKYKVDLYPRDEFGRYPFHTCCYSHIATINEDISVLKYFEALGKLTESDLNLRDDNGNTLLHTAANYGNKAAVEYLLSLGADRSAKNNEGLTPALD